MPTLFHSRRHLTLRARLTIWYVVVLLVTLSAFGINALLLQHRLALSRLDQGLDGTHDQLTGMLGEELRELDTPALAASETVEVIAGRTRAVAILAADSSVLASTLEPQLLASILGDATLSSGVRTVAGPMGPWRLDIRRTTVDGLAVRMIVASTLVDVERDQRAARDAMLFGIPLALLLAGGGGLWIAAAGLKPITSMARRAAQIPSTGLEDLGTPARDDELGQLTRAFNELVARLRNALRTQQQFMADASHELRSPVSVIRTAAEVTLSRARRDEAEYREALTMTGAQARQMGAMVDDMLLLARADSGAYPLRTVDLCLRELADECARAIGVIAAGRRISVQTTGDTEVAIRGDEQLLRRLLVNLLQNAVQHAPSGELVVVDVHATDTGALVRVIDHGPGIPDEARSHIFNRFFQLDPSRRSQGAGLGLTIARWIAEAHRGSLDLEATSSLGSTFLVTLPRTS